MEAGIRICAAICCRSLVSVLNTSMHVGFYDILFFCSSVFPHFPTSPAPHFPSSLVAREANRPVLGPENKPLASGSETATQGGFVAGAS